MSRPSVLLFLALVLSCSAQLLNVTQQIALNSPYNTSFSSPNLHTSATLSVTSALPIVLCFVPKAFQLPYFTQYSALNCALFVNTTGSNPFNVPLPLRTGDYTVGVYLARTDGTNGTSSTIIITGDSCPDTTFWDGTQCVQSSPLNNNTLNFAAGETKFFTITAPPHIGVLTLTVTAATDDSVDSSVVIKGRYNGNSFSFPDASANGTLVAPAPHAGPWVFSVTSPSAASLVLETNVSLCPPNQAGPGCTISVSTPQNWANLSTPQGSYDKWAYFMTNGPFNVSVTTNNASTIPLLFVSNGNIPIQQSTADVSNCNGQYCDIVRSININATSTSYWYIAVGPSALGTNVTYAIWWNSTCIVGCETDNQGLCDPSGKCNCEIDYVGLDCSIPNGLGPQYIVLIIIASLVVISATVGFIAWAYMKRKRSTYEIVS